MEMLVLGIMAAMAGFMRGALSLVLEHPLDVIKTWWQAHPHQNSFKRVVSDIYTAKGFFGFYTGAVPNLIRVSSKSAYRYPLMLFIPYMYGTFLTSVAMISIFAGLTIALLEVGVITPLERIKVWMMTSTIRKNPLLSFFKSKTPIYRGTGIVAVRQITTWVTFLLTQDQLILLAYEITQQQSLDVSSVLCISLVSGAINTFFVLPLDCIKTNIQKYDAHNNFWSVTRDIYQSSGLYGFYVGWGPRMVQYMINSLFTVAILENFRKSF